MLQIYDIPSKNLKNQPRIRGRPMPGVQKPDPDPGDIYARCAETRLRFKGHLCPVCRNPPQIQGTFMPDVQKHDPDSRHIYARCAETRPGFKGHLCPVCRNMPQIQGTFMHGVHCLPPDSSLIFKECAWQKNSVIRCLNLSSGPDPGDRLFQALYNILQ